MKVTYIVVANAARARILRARRAGEPVEEIETLVNPAARLHERALTSDAPGRTYDSAGRGRHALERLTDAKDAESLEFSRRIRESLQALHEHEPDCRIVLVAAPAMLGLLRKHLGKPIMRLVEQELDKDFSSLDEDELARRLGLAR